jgi:hypothetical protein
MLNRHCKFAAACSVLLLAAALGLAPRSARADLGQCAQPFSPGADPSASDCLFILKAATGSATCDDPCICAPKGSLPVRATDALICLIASVGAPASLNCPCTDLRAPAYQFTPNPDVVDASIRSRFVATDYIGAFPQGVSPTTGDWTKGWTLGLHGNNTVWEPADGGTLNGAVPSANGACPTGTTDIGNTNLGGGFAGSMDICQLNARYAVNGQTITLTNDNVYRLGGPANQGTIFGNGDALGKTPATSANTTLVIEPGTLILGVETEALTITRGANLIVNGTAADPVVMESLTWFQDWVAGGDGSASDAEWGGLVISGFGVSNKCNDPTTCDALAEGFINPVGWGGGSGPGGTVDNNDDSGEIHYLVVSHGGFDLDGNGSELNGITFYGVGFATEVDHIMVNDNFDDSVEFFGGKVVATHVVGFSAGDDTFDSDNGWHGGVQFGLIKQETDLADRGFESDNSADSLGTPKTQMTYANITILGASDGGPTLTPEGMHLRRATGAFLWNGIVQGSERSCIRVDGNTLTASAGVLANPDDGILQIHNYVVNCTTNLEGTGGDTTPNVTTWYDADTNNRRGVDPTVGPTGYPGDATNP